MLCQIMIKLEGGGREPLSSFLSDCDIQSDIGSYRNPLYISDMHEYLWKLQC